MTTQLETMLASAQEGRREKARREYVEILSRASNPKPEDGERLAEICEMLGKTVEDVRGDSYWLGRVVALEGQLAKMDTKGAAERLANATAAIKEHNEKVRQLAEQNIATAEKLIAEQKAASDAIHPINDARRELNKARQRIAHLKAE